MKKHYSVALILLVSFICNAQQFTVTLSPTAKINLKQNSTDKDKVTLIFGESQFKNKTISFYTKKNNDSLFAKAIFGQDISKHTDEGQPSFYKIDIDKVLHGFGNDAIKVKADTIHFRIDGGSFQQLILTNIKKADTDSGKKEADDPDLKNALAEDAILLYTSDSTKIVNLNALKIKLLKKYNITNQDSLDKNPFLKDILKVDFDDKSTAKSKEDKGSIESDAFKKLGGIDVTKAANALSDILIEHAKQELTIAFFNKFKKFEEDHPEFKILFPVTANNLENLLSYKYPEMLPTLRKGFEEDIRKITFKLDDVLLLPKYQFLAKDYPEIIVAIRSIRLIHQLENNSLNTSAVLKEFSGFKEWDTASDYKFKNVGSALKVANLFNESISKDTLLEDQKAKRIWVDSKNLAKLFNDELLFKFYLGLLYQKANQDKINFYNKDKTTKAFSTMLTDHAEDIFFFQNKVQEFVDLTTKVQNTVVAITNKSTPKTNDDYNAYIGTSIDVIEYGFSLYKHFDDSMEVSDDYIKVMRLSNELYKNIYQENYNVAISNTIDIFTVIKNIANTKANTVANNSEALKKLAENNKKELSKWSNQELDNLIGATTDNNIKSAIYQLKLNKLFDFIEKAKPYILFMANMVEAKDEAAIKAALNDVILPVGSSSVKKHSLYNFNVQAYLGARYSFTPAANAATTTWNEDFAISVPIGFGYSWGLDAWGINKGGALTVFAPLFDLGAVVDYKLKSETDQNGNTVQTQDYTIKLGQIFSPGLYVVYGLPYDIPISIGYGMQYGPGLSKINSDNSTETTKPYWKWNIFLSVDIPLFNLNNKPDYKKR